jgi:hypothetical protein
MDVGIWMVFELTINSTVQYRKPALLITNLTMKTKQNTLQNTNLQEISPGN